MFRAQLSTSARRYATSAIAGSSKKVSGPVLAAKNPEDYFDNSAIPTYAFQASLPKLPLPKLNSTLDKYLGFVRPLVDDATFAQTQAAVEEFRSNEGPAVHAALASKDLHNPDTSYIADIWYDMYLKNRDPFPLNLTPYLGWKDNAIPEKNEQAARATDLVVAAVRFQRSLDAQKLKPDVWRMKPAKSEFLEALLVNLLPRQLAYYPMYFMEAYALDMSQYKNLFYSTRLPFVGKDELKVYSPTRHIVVLRGSDLYKVNVLDESFRPYGPEAIEAQLRGILAEPLNKAKESALGSLTTLDRDSWANERAALEKNGANKAALAEVDSAMFALTLEDATPNSVEQTSRLMLHGDAQNRWWDKSFNLIVAPNGSAAISWEHAWGDGVAVLNFFNTAYEELVTVPVRPPAGAVAPQKINFDLTPATKSAIQAAADRVSKQISECDLKIYHTDSMTKKDIKKSGLSPDGVMQMAMQLAHWRTHGYTPSTYESASTAGFKHGRTETIRSASAESVKFCQAFDDKSMSLVEKYHALKNATERHGKTTKDALTGQGVDRHLSALEDTAAKRGYGKPAIFSDKGMQVYRDIRLSTSTLSSPALGTGGFGPVSRTSYGVGYGTEDHGCGFHVMSYGLDATGMCDNLGKAMAEMREAMLDGRT